MPDVNRYKKKRNNNMSDGNTDKKKKYLKNHCYKRKKMLNYLINCIEELKNENFQYYAYLRSKQQIFKFRNYEEFFKFKNYRQI